MAFWNKLADILHDPAPEYVFELSEAGIAFFRQGMAAPEFRPLEPGVISVSPLTDNVQKPDALADAVRSIVTGGAGRKRRSAVLVLPDYCARVSVLEFDKLPADEKEQHALVKFRMKKTVPFDVESAAVSFHSRQGKSKTDVIVVVAALEIVARYEAPFRAAGLHPGVVTTSALAITELNREPGVSIVARLNGRTLSVIVMRDGGPRLVRTVELAEASADEILAVLIPTIAYIEDELTSHPARLMIAGFGEDGRAPDWAVELGIPIEPLRSKFGMPSQFNAGLLGYLEGSSTGVKAA
jgi:type IV pilus assembly protein PilM